MSDEKLEEKIKSLMEKVPKRNILDKLIDKIISRKLVVFATATCLLAYSGLDSETWGLIAVCYIGGQSVIDAVQVWRHGR